MQAQLGEVDRQSQNCISYVLNVEDAPVSDCFMCLKNSASYETV